MYCPDVYSLIHTNWREDQEHPSAQWLLIGTVGLLIERWAQLVTDVLHTNQTSAWSSCGCGDRETRNTEVSKACRGGFLRTFLAQKQWTGSQSPVLPHPSSAVFPLVNERGSRPVSAVMQVCLVASACCGVTLAHVSERSPIQSPGLGVTSMGLLSKAACVRCTTSPVESQVAWTWGSSP